MTKGATTRIRNNAVKALKVLGGMTIGAGVIIAGFFVSLVMPSITPKIAAAGTTAVTTGLMIVGGVLGVGMISYVIGCVLDSEAKALADNVLKQAINIREQLKKMLIFGEQIKKELNDLDIIKSEQMKQHVKQLETVTARKKIKKSSLKIIKYLNEYQIKGKEIIKQVDNAQKTIICSIDKKI